MRYRIDFPAEPDTTYVIESDSNADALIESYELARRLHRSEWSVTSPKDEWHIRYQYAPTVQIIRAA